MSRQCFVSRTDNLIYIFQFFKTMCAQSDNTCRRKDWCIECRRKIQHAVYKAAVEVHIGINTFVDLSLLSNDLRAKTLHEFIERILFFVSFFSGQFLDKHLENLCSRVGNRVNCMSHSVNQTLFIEGLLIKKP